MIGLATRGFGGIEFLRDLLPGVALEALGLLTWLGSVALLVPLVVLVYWFESREAGAFALAAVLGGISVTVALKAGFGLSRPPDSLWLIAASGFGFPSGHAIDSTVGWGALAARVDRGTKRQRFAVAAVVVAVVALSRVAVGVHFAIDVLVGIAVGAAYLGLILWLDSPGRAFGVATLVAILAAVATGGAGNAMLLLGASAGGWLAWSQLPVAGSPWGSEGILPAIGGVAVFGGLVFVGYRGQLATPLEVGIGTIAFAGIVGLPAMVDRFPERPAGK